MAAIEGSTTLGENASEVGVAPRLRSLHIASEEPDASASDALTPRRAAVTPTRAGGSLSEGERSPLRGRMASTDASVRRSLLKGLQGMPSRYGKAAMIVLQAIGVACLIAGAFYAGKAFSGVPSSESDVSSALTSVLESVSNKQQPVTGTQNLDKESRKILKGAPKAVVYGSDKAASAALSSSLTNQHLKIYIAELKAKYNTDLLEAVIGLGQSGALTQVTKEEADRKRQEQAAKVAEMLASPFGKQLENDVDGLRVGLPNNLDFLFHLQLQSSPLRVANHSEADVVFVPFYIQKLVTIDKELEKPNKYALALTDFWAEVKELLPQLGKKPHLLVVPGQEAELRANCGGHGINFLCNPIANDFTILTTELFSGRPSSFVSSKIAPGMIGSGLKEGGSAVAIPDNANIHFSQHSAMWQAAFDATSLQSTKALVAAEAFRPRAPIRKALKAQCLKNEENCTHYEPQLPLHSSSLTSAAAVRKNNLAAWFSLHPPGDTAIRAALYDCMLADTIPTVFDPKLPRILPFADVIDWESFLALINAEDITKNKKDVIEILTSKYPVEERLTRLATLHQIRHLLQYSFTPVHYLVRFDHLSLVTRQDDAFSMSLKAGLKNICRQGLLPDRCPGGGKAKGTTSGKKISGR